MSKRGHEYRSNEQRKSVFDRLGQQLAATGQRQMNEPEFTHYKPRDSQPSQAELDWHYQNERRQMNVPVKDRHHPPMNMGPPYQMEMMNRPTYYPPHMGSYHDAGPPMPGPPMMGHNGPMQMGMQRREMQKFESRQGNMMVGGFKDRPMRMMPVGPPGPYPMGAMSPPPPNFMGARQMLPPGHEMSPMRPTGMYPPQRWPDNMEMAGQQERMLPMDEPFAFPGYPPPQQPPMLNPESGNAPMPIGGQEVPRYAKWRERRDFITNLDRETAQSSSRTDSLKSSLQQHDPQSTKNNQKTRRQNCASRQAKQVEQNKSDDKTNQSQPTGTNESNENEPHDISDGEIVDDEDTSDGSDIAKNVSAKKLKIAPASNVQTQSDTQGSDTNKRRRIADREDYSMDYETISDEDLDDFMGDKKLSDLGSEDAKLSELKSQASVKNSSEIELLNTLGLDWANLIEMSKQTRASKESQTSGSALMRFSLQNYLPTLKITEDLAGPEIFDLINKVCRA